MSGLAPGRSRENLEAVVYPRMARSGRVVDVRPSQVCAAQEALVSAFLSDSDPVDSTRLLPAVQCAQMNWVFLPMEVRKFIGTMALHWLGCHGGPEHAYIALDALTCCGCDGHDSGLYILCFRVLPVMRFIIVRSTYPRQ